MSANDLSVGIGADLSDLDRGFALAVGKVRGFANSISGATKVASDGFEEVSASGGKLKALGGLFPAGLALSLVAMGGKALQAAGDIEALEKGFAATYKGSLPLQDALSKVRELAKLPGLGLKEALQGATNLQAAGFSADLATRALGAFGNALATVGKGKADLDGVGLALGQIASKGKISSEEINQLAERVPQIRQAMIAAFGSADTEVLQKAKISATDFVEGVTRELEKLPTVSGGINNAFENIGDAGFKAVAKLGSAFNTAFNIEGGVDMLSVALDRLGDGFTALGPRLAAAADYMRGKWDELRAYFTDGEGGRVFNDLAISVTESVRVILGAFTKLGAGETFGALVSASGLIKTLFEEAARGITAISDTISGVIKAVTALFEGEFRTALQEAGNASEAFTRPLRTLLGLVNKTPEGSGINPYFAAFNTNIAGFLQVAPKAAEAVEAIAQAANKPAPIGLTDEQTKALTKLRDALVDNANNSRALGDSYDYLGGKQSALESGIKSLVAAGFSPAGQAVQQFVRELKGIPEALDQIEGRLSKGIAAPKIVRPEDQQAFDTGLNTDLPKLAYDDKFAAAAKAQQDKIVADQDAFRAKYGASVDATIAINEQFGPMLASGLANAAVAIGEAAGAVISGASSLGEGLAQALGSVIGIFGSFLVDFGKMLVTQATLTLAAANLATNPVTAPAAIAIGLAAIAAGVAIGALSKGGPFRAGGGGASIAPSAGTTAPRSISPITAAPIGPSQPQLITHLIKVVAEGEDLAGVYEIYTDKLGRVVGRR